MSAKKIAMISGATGYVGSALCNRLLDAGWSVAVVVRSDTTGSDRKLHATWAGRAAEVIYDGTLKSLGEGVASIKPDIVFHLASLFIAEHRSEQVTDLINSNVLFGAHLVEACARTGIINFINTGTSWQHYRSEAYDPVCLYAATKQAFEDILDFYADAFGMKAITLKLFDTYGPEDTRPKLVNLLLRAVRNGEFLGMSPGNQGLDLLHIDDVTSAFIKCAESLPTQSIGKHERYDASSGHVLSLRELVALLVKVSGRTLNVKFGARPYRQREVMVPAKAGQPPPGWKPIVELEHGLLGLLQAVADDNAQATQHS